MLVGFYLLNGDISLKTKRTKLLQHKFINRDFMVPSNHSILVISCSAVFIPRMRPNLLNRISFLRISIEDFLQKISSICTYKTWDMIFPGDNFLIKLLCVFIFKRKIPTQYRIHNHTATSYINLQSFVFLASYHLRGSVTWRPTCRL